MPQLKTKPADRTTRASAPAEPSIDWLTQAAFVLSVGIALARATMLEVVHGGLFDSMGGESFPRGPGPATIVVLNLLACVPALLVLARRVIDSAYTLRAGWSYLPMALLAAWALFSPLWAGNKFEAAVSASTLAAALVFLWSTSQLVRSWRRLRVVGAMCGALLVVLVAQGFYYRFVEAPQLQDEWKRSGAQILIQRGWDPGSFEAVRFTRKVFNDEAMGFSASPNTYAALMVLTAVICAGMAIQRLRDGTGITWALALAAPLPPALYVVSLTHSKTAGATLLLGALLLAFTGLSRGRLARHAGLAYAAVVAATLATAALIVAVGMRYGKLFQDSLNFRWRYWVASARLFVRHPLHGVGWENFGPAYLGVRLPSASEEIRDPHNLIVRFFVELGIVGGLLLLAWLLRLGWELARPVMPEAPPSAAGADKGRDPLHLRHVRRHGAVGLVAAIALIAVVLNVVASIDFHQPADYWIIELMKRAAMLCILVVCGTFACLRSTERQELDGRPAPWVLYSMLIGIGLFLLHNMVDFSLFETGPMFVFALVTGAALGVRQREGVPRPRGRTPAAAALGAGSLLLLIAAGAFARPILEAESLAAEAEAASGAGRPAAAVTALQAAALQVPYNADYRFRAARAAMGAREAPQRVRELLDVAIAADPTASEYYHLRGAYEFSLPQPDVTRARQDFERGLALDPNNVALRLEYAGALRGIGLGTEAALQYTDAARFNDLLSPDEPKRLPPAQLHEIRHLVSGL